MFKLFSKPKPKRKVLTRAERRERIMQRLRAMKPGWPDDKLKAFAVAQIVTEPARVRQSKRAQYDAEVAALEAEGNRLLANMEANAPKYVSVPLSNGHVEQMLLGSFLEMQRALAESVRTASLLPGRPLKADVIVEHGQRVCAREHCNGDCDVCVAPGQRIAATGGAVARERELLAELNRIAREHGLPEA
jgi:hypothetical protein